MTDRKTQPAVFLDRDDTIIGDPGYISDPDHVRLLPGAAEAIAQLRAEGYLIVVVSNQSGIARGILTEGQLANVHQRLQDLLVAQGAGLDAIYYCPYLEGPEAVIEKYRRKSDLRKPAPGMLLMAAQEMDIDLAASWMIGNSERDVLAGQAAGCRTILLTSRDSPPSDPANFVAPNLLDAANIVLEKKTAESVEMTTSTTPANIAQDPPIQPDHLPVTNELKEPPTPPTASTPPPTMNPPTPIGGSSPVDVLFTILEEIRSIRREGQHEDFSIAKLAAALAQTLSLCALAWSIHSWMTLSNSTDPSATATNATIGLLVAIVFELMTIAFLLAGKKS